MTKSLLLSLPVLLATAVGPAVAAEKMNVVVLYADDWRHDTLGVAGNPVVKTPHLDQLASEGMRFTENCVTTSICGISRANLYTGQWMSRHGARRFVMWDTPWEETYLGLLKKNGYYLGHVGKWHNGRIPQGGFDFAVTYHGRHWYNTKEYGRVHVTKRNEKDALKYLKNRPKDQPFYLTVSFFATHAEDGHKDQYLPQPDSMKLYEDVMIPVPPNATQESWERLPEFFDEKNEGRNRWHWRFDDSAKYQRMMRNYYRMATEVDFTLSVDLAPTILAAVGIAAPKNMQGKDIAPLYLSKEKPRWRSDFFYEHPTFRNKDFIPASEALVRKDWKYMYWPEDNVEQLFDLQADPREENDLAGDPAQAKKLAEMRKRFNELKEAAK